MAKLGDMLVKDGIITRDQLQTALNAQKVKHDFLGNILVREKIITEAQLLENLTKQTGFPIIDLDSVELSPNLAKTVPWQAARKDGIVPVQEIGNLLHIAMVDPEDPSIVDNLAFRTGKKIKVFLTGPESLKRAWQKLYGDIDKLDSELLAKGMDSLRSKMIMKAKELSSDMSLVTKDYSKTDEEIDEKEDEETAKNQQIDNFDEIVEGAIDNVEIVDKAEEDVSSFGLSVAAEAPPIVKLVNGILIKAIDMGASDIHIEPFEKEYRVRFRIDGVLHLVMNLPTTVKNAVTSRIKIMANCDIAERRLPQDGRVKVKLAKRKQVEFRVSTLPSVFGEKIVMRILGQTNLKPSVRDLGFGDPQIGYVEDALESPYGIILVTGPTGSGKSTTLYTALNQLNTMDTNIVTAEDPVEFNLPGVTQVPVRTAIGYTFAMALRAFLRQDPDIIMVGEMRDQETAIIAVRAALTGHLVFSTLHTNDAPSTIVRLIDMDVDRFLVAAATKLVIAQRLVRCICKNCAEPTTMDDRTIDHLHLIGVTDDVIKDLKPFKGKGCEKCTKIGYKGRHPVFEVMPIKDKRLIAGITAGKPTEELTRIFMECGYWTLQDFAMHLVNKGVTTLDEAFKVCVGKSE